MRTTATYFDGKSAQAHDATLELFGPTVQVTLSDRAFSVNNETSRVVEPLGNGDWAIELPDRQQIRFTNKEFGNALCVEFRESRFVGRMERSWRWALLALIVAIAGSWAILTFGVPVAARHIAFAVPPELDKKLGRESIDLLDRIMFEESELSDDQTAPIRAAFANILAEHPESADYQLVFRSADAIGANAFAVPGGLVVVTDQMVGLFENDAEIASVLAHEVGHLRYRHSLRILLQNSVSAVFIAGLTGDLSNITALSATVPTVLMQAKYSRDFEHEADGFAFDYMEAHGMDMNALSNLLQRVDAGADRPGSSGIGDWLSSHPQSTERNRDTTE